MSDILPHDSHVTAAGEVRRLAGQNAKILARLEDGPATRRELAEIAVNVTARISDLRHAGHEVRCLEKPNGASSYWLVKPRSEWRGHDLNAPRDGRLI